MGMFVHQGRVIATCCLFMGAGSFTMFLPHLLGGLYELGPRAVEVCDLSGKQHSLYEDLLTMFMQFPFCDFLFSEPVVTPIMLCPCVVF